jgi:cytochrome c oxidase accessory protein FixG
MGLVTFLYILTPFVKFKGIPLLRIDITDGNLYAFGWSAPFTDLFPLLLLLLALLFGFLFIAVGFGRLWCGWVCPQTILSEFAELAWFGSRKRSKTARVIIHGVFLVLSFLLAMVFCLYFVDISVFMPPAFLLVPGWGSGAFLVLAAVFYLDMVLVRRTFCTNVCPYGRILTVLTDETGLRVAMDPDRKDTCMRCAACVAACPMGLDVREGPNAECVQCGLCIEACSGRFSETEPEGIVHFYLGDEEGRRGRVISRRAFIPLAASLLLAAAFLVTVSNTPDSRFNVRRSAGAGYRVLSDGRQAHFFTAQVSSAFSEPEEFMIMAADPGGEKFPVRGQGGSFQLKPGGKVQVGFAVLLPPEESWPARLVFSLALPGGQVIETLSIKQERGGR